MSRKCFQLAAIGLGVALIASCGSEDEAAPPTVTIVTYSSFQLETAVEEKIESELGIDLVIHSAGDAGEALSGAILTAGQPEGDIFFGIDNTTVSRAVESGVIEEMDFDELTNLNGLSPALAGFATEYLVPISSSPVCVDYDKAWFEDAGIDPPTSLEDLTEERYRDLLVVQSPATSSPGLVFLMATYTAVDDPQGFWDALVANGVSISGSWDDAWNVQYSINGGDRPLVVSYASSPPAEVFYSEGAIEEPQTGVIEATCADQVEFAGVLSGSENSVLAAKVVNAMLGADWQAAIPLSNFVYPAIDSVELPELFTQFAPRPADVITLDPEVIDKNRDDWIDQWRDIAE